MTPTRFLIRLIFRPYCVLRYLLRNPMKISSTRKIQTAYQDAITNGRLTRAGGLQHASAANTEEMIAEQLSAFTRQRPAWHSRARHSSIVRSSLDTQPFEPTQERKARAGSSLGKIAISAAVNIGNFRRAIGGGREARIVREAARFLVKIGNVDDVRSDRPPPD